MATVLGSRQYFYYVSDTGREYAMLRRFITNNNCGNESVLPGAFPDLPKSLKPRHILLIAPNGTKRKVDIGVKSNTLFTNGGTVTIDGVIWTVSGRVGEQDKGSVKE